MIWIFCIIGAILCLVFAEGKSDKLLGFTMWIVIPLIIGLIIALASSNIAADHESFWQVNHDVYLQAIAKTDSAVVSHNVAGPMDLGIQLENNAIAGETAKRVREWRDKLLSYNKSIVWNVGWRKCSWILYPFYIQPDTSCKVIGSR